MARCGINSFEALTQIVSEVGNGIFVVADELCFGLCAMIFFTVDIGQYGGYLPVSILVRNDLNFSFALDMRYRTVRVTEGYSDGILFWRIRRQDAIGLVTHSKIVVVRD